MKIGILGCGYIGETIAKQWKQAGHIVSVTTRNNEKIESLKTFSDHVHLLNPQDSHSYEDFIQNQNILLICVAPGLNSDYRTTYLDTAISVASCASRAPGLKQILYIGSTSVYGECGGEWVDETTPVAPLNENGEILAETEKVLLACRTQDLNICIFRLGEIYGPKREIESRLIRMNPCSFPGTGESYTNLIHRDDILKALDFGIVNDLNGIYNLCNNYHVPRRDFYDLLCKQENLSPIRWNPSQISAHAGNRRVSNKKIKAIGFSFDHPLFVFSS